MSDFASNGMEFYYAIINILDGMALTNKNLTPEFEAILNCLLEQANEICASIQDIADANNCDYDENTTWEDLLNEFKRLWKEGDRV